MEQLRKTAEHLSLISLNFSASLNHLLRTYAPNRLKTVIRTVIPARNKCLNQQNSQTFFDKVDNKKRFNTGTWAQTVKAE